MDQYQWVSMGINGVSIADSLYRWVSRYQGAAEVSRYQVSMVLQGGGIKVSMVQSEVSSINGEDANRYVQRGIKVSIINVPREKVSMMRSTPIGIKYQCISWARTALSSINSEAQRTGINGINCQIARVMKCNVQQSIKVSSINVPKSVYQVSMCSAMSSKVSSRR